MMTRLLPKLRAFRHDRGGNVAIITALAAIPMFGMLGFAIDYGMAVSQKIKLDAAADSAALSAITTAQSVIQNGGTTQAGVSAGITAANKYFAANAGQLAFATTPVFTPQIVRNGQVLTATVNYSTTTSTNFSGLIGIPSMPIVGTAKSTLGMKTYIDYYIVTDTSQSMGIAATAPEMQRLYDLVVSTGNGTAHDEPGCVFGCHVPTNKYPSGVMQTVSNEQLAHAANPPITLRIDAAVSAIQTIITQAKDVITQKEPAAGTAGSIRIGLYTMSDDPVTHTQLTTVSSLSGDFAALTRLAGTITLGNNVSGGFGDSAFPTSLSQFSNNILASSGDGSSRALSKKYVFLITDGLQDSCTNSHCTKAFDPIASGCPGMKAKATVGVIYTTFLPIYLKNNAANGLQGDYSRLAAPYVSQIAPNLTACATSPDLYYEAVDGPAIATGMKKLFASTILDARIAQ